MKLVLGSWNEAMLGSGGPVREAQGSGGEVMKLMVKVRQEGPQLASSGSTCVESCSLQPQIYQLDYIFFFF